MMTVTLLLAIAAFVAALFSAFGWVPLWVAVILLCIAELLRTMPLGR